MISTAFKLAWRNLTKRKVNTIINIAGLTIGFATFLLIMLVVRYEESFDAFHKNKKNIYRVARVGRGENPEYRAGVPFPVPTVLANDYPSIGSVVPMTTSTGVQINVTTSGVSELKRFKESFVLFTTPKFFEMFDFPLAMGDKATSLADPNTILLSKKIASKYFGDWSLAVGKTVNMFGLEAKITGILENPPSNTDFPADIIMSYSTYAAGYSLNDWGSISDDHYCMVMLNSKVSAPQFAKQLIDFTDKHIKPVNPGYVLTPQPLADIHYDARFGTYTGKTFSRDLIIALKLIGAFLLIIACVNFVNLSTAGAISRAKEVGVRKVLGSNRSQLMLQFLRETALITALALLISVAVAFLLIGPINNFLSIELTARSLFNTEFVLFMIGSLVVVTLLAGLYPAFVLARFKPVLVLKSTLLTDNKGISFRRALVVFQFIIAQVLIIGTLVVASQMSYFRNADLGFNKESVVKAEFQNDSVGQLKQDAFRTKLQSIPGVSFVSLSTFTPMVNGGWSVDLRKITNHDKLNPDMIIGIKPADTGYFRLYDLQFAAGHAYAHSDTIKEFVVNETVIHKLGFKTAADAVGTEIDVMGKRRPIVGVVKDYHANSLRDPIGPVVMTSMKEVYGTVNVKLKLRNSKEVIGAMKKIWAEFFPEQIFEYSFLENDIANFYQQENQLSYLYKIFSGVAIFISCLGLYGLISFMAVQRKKEIAIRKVLGAPVKNIVAMLSKEFTILVIIAFAVAAPLAWYFMHQWLEQYAYRISLGIGLFALTICGAIVIAWCTVGYTAIKAALANPVKSLRSE